GEMVFRWPVRILFIDTDASGRIHYTALLRYFEAAEIELFREAGAMEDRAEVEFPRVHVECDYRTAIHFDDEIVIELAVGNMGRSSIELRYRAMKQGMVAASGQIIIAAMNRRTGRSTEIPLGVREKLEPWNAPRVSA
ncbi:MAG TPA: thioesterase family protein, partial [Bryobacteraceae bacterium]|nr:thioesterase family protein [Bryobacteraceae bacterium]